MDEAAVAVAVAVFAGSSSDGLPALTLEDVAPDFIKITVRRRSNRRLDRPHAWAASGRIETFTAR